jgi:type II secretory pathway predicted ATPase ExeA
VHVRDPHIRQPPDNETTVVRPIDGPERRTPRSNAGSTEASAARSARVIKAARALSAPAAAPVSRSAPDSSIDPLLSTTAIEPQVDLRDSPAPAASTQPARGSRPRRRLLNLFPESALQPEPAASSRGPQLVFQPRVASTPPDAPTPSDATFNSAASTVHDLQPMPSIDSQTDMRRVRFEQAKDDLLAAIRIGGGPVILTAPAGTGKSVLCRTVMQELDGREVASLVPAPKSFDELLKMMLADFGVMTTESAAHADIPRPRLLDALRSFLESLASLHARAVVFIDQAESVPAAVLAEVHAMSAAPHAGVLQLVLSGRPELNERLKRRVLHDLDASVAHRVKLESPQVQDAPIETATSATIADASAMVDTTPDESTTADLELERPRRSTLGRLLIVAAVASIVLAGAGALLWVVSIP